MLNSSSGKMEKIFVILCAACVSLQAAKLSQTPSKQEIKDKFMDACVMDIIDVAQSYAMASAYCECVFYEAGSSLSDSAKNKVGLDSKKIERARATCSSKFLK